MITTLMLMTSARDRDYTPEKSTPVFADYHWTRLLQATNNEELFVHLLRSEKGPVQTVDIIRGSDGTRIGAVKLPTCGLNLDCILTHPATGQMVVTDICKEDFGQDILVAHPLLADNRVVIMSHYTFHRETGCSLLYTDALLAGPKTDPLQSNFDYPLTTPAINPFYRAALLSFVELSPAGHPTNPESQWVLQSHPFVATEKSAVRAAVETVLQNKYNQTSLPCPPLRQCFVLGTTVTAGTPSRLGPLGPENLNYDVLQIIWSYLTPRDLVRSKRVCKEWQATSQEWLKKIATKLQDEFSDPAVQLDSLSVTERNQYICRLHAMRTGEAGLASTMEYDDNAQFAGVETLLYPSTLFPQKARPS
ncbi:hypothetical protein BDW74DRAFT_184300 [Aspergillus multicolor]|uniref:F-box protein n=1 Tax=Aspergillus multicolor TaxID=41759 RepID=UPI003CCD3668